MTPKTADWFYGADACFPKAVEWHTWGAYWRDRYNDSQPIEKFLVDATLMLQKTFIKMAKTIRQNDQWTRNYSGEEMSNILDTAGEANAWFERNRPRDDQMQALDPRLLFIAQALGGAFSVMQALAAELDQINRKGFVLVNTSAEMQELATAPGH